MGFWQSIWDFLVAVVEGIIKINNEYGLTPFAFFTKQLQPYYSPTKIPALDSALFLIASISVTVISFMVLGKFVKGFWIKTILSIFLFLLMLHLFSQTLFWILFAFLLFFMVGTFIAKLKARKAEIAKYGKGGNPEKRKKKNVLYDPHEPDFDNEIQSPRNIWLKMFGKFKKQDVFEKQQSVVENNKDIDKKDLKDDSGQNDVTDKPKKASGLKGRFGKNKRRKNMGLLTEYVLDEDILLGHLQSDVQHSDKFTENLNDDVNNKPQTQLEDTSNNKLVVTAEEINVKLTTLPSDNKTKNLAKQNKFAKMFSKKIKVGSADDATPKTTSADDAVVHDAKPEVLAKQSEQLINKDQYLSSAGKLKEEFDNFSITITTSTVQKNKTKDIGIVSAPVGNRALKVYSKKEKNKKQKAGRKK